MRAAVTAPIAGVSISFTWVVVMVVIVVLWAAVDDYAAAATTNRRRRRIGCVDGGRGPLWRGPAICADRLIMADVGSSCSSGRLLLLIVGVVDVVDTKVPGKWSFADTNVATTSAAAAAKP